MSTFIQGEDIYKEGLGNEDQFSKSPDDTRIGAANNVDADDDPSFAFQDGDAQIRQLEASGDLDFVVGSRSVLSQELATDSQISQPGDDQCGATSIAISTTKEEQDIVVEAAQAAAQLFFSTQGDTNAAVARQQQGTFQQAGKTDARSAQLMCLVDAVRYRVENDPMDNTEKENDSATGDGEKSRKVAPLISRKQIELERSEKIRYRVQQEQYAQRLAKRAAALAKEVLNSPDLAKEVLLSMALQRKSPRSPPSQWPEAGTVLKEGYCWHQFPPLEKILKVHMAEYYELSLRRQQSKQQQSFNNMLVAQVREKAKELNWKFDASFTDKRIRERIRCYYKTHIQNARKRLKTMVENPTKRANSKSLLQHYDLIKKHAVAGCFGEEPEVEEQNQHLVAAAQPSDPKPNEPTISEVAQIVSGSSAAQRSKPKPPTPGSEVKQVAQIMSGFQTLGAGVPEKLSMQV